MYFTSMYACISCIIGPSKSEKGIKFPKNGVSDGSEHYVGNRAASAFNSCDDPSPATHFPHGEI